MYLARGSDDVFQYGGFYHVRLIFNLVVPSITVLLIMWRRYEFGFVSKTNARPSSWDDRTPAISEISKSSAAFMTVGLEERLLECGTIPSGILHDQSHDKNCRFSSRQQDAKVSYGEVDNNNEEDDEDDDIILGAAEDMRCSTPDEVLSTLRRCLKVAEVLQSKSTVAPRPNSISASDGGNRNSRNAIKSMIVVVLENLRPADCLCPLVHGFMNNICLPAAERAFDRHNKLAIRLLEATDPSLIQTSSQQRTAAAFEHARQRDRLKITLDGITLKFKNWVELLATLASNVPSGANSDLLFKPSTEKSCSAVAHFATNLQVHSSTVKFICPDSDLEFSSSSMDAITFGAPSAHALNFKSGGLRQMRLELETMVTDGEVSPESILKRLEVRFMLGCREGVVLSQALAGVTSAAIASIASCIREKRTAFLVQISKIGLLIHSVSLLSTFGNERVSIQNFVHLRS
jgi:hypothetical protein